MIIIPTYNERKNIRILVGRIRALLPEIPILFVEDSSPDGTADEIKSLQTEDKHIHMLLRPKKSGFASAYLDGFRFVERNFYPEFIITMDADLSHPPEKLPEMIEIAVSGRVGVGSRYVKGGGVRNWKLRRKVLSRAANFYARIFTNLPLKDLTSGFMAIPYDKLRLSDLDGIRSWGYAFLMELKAHLARGWSEFVEVPIIFEERRSGESKIGSNIILEGFRYPIKNFLLRQIQKNYPAWLTFFISLYVYTITLPKTIFFGDSPEFMAQAATLGIAHPPGYPLYGLMGKLFTFLPWQNLEFRIGLFSAVCASLSLVIFYFLFLKITSNRIVSFVTSLILGFSSLFWSQAIMAKIYMPFLLILLVIFLLFAKFWETPRPKYLIWAAFLFGLGFGMHQIIILFLPLLGFALFVYLHSIEKGFTQRYRFTPLLLGVLLFVLGLSVYAYLPIRSQFQGNFYDFSRIFHNEPTHTGSGFYSYVMRTEYQDFGGDFIWQDKLKFLTSFFEGLWKQFYWFLVLLPVGLIGLILWNKKFFVLTFAAFWINILGIILLRSSTWNYENEVLYSFYYLPAYALSAIWIGLGLCYLFGWLEKNIPRENVLRLSMVMLVLPLGMLYMNIQSSDLSKFSFVDEYTREVLESLEPNAILLVQYTGSNADTLLFGYHYQQLVKGVRSDVTILKVADIYPEVDREALSFVFGLKDPKAIRFHLVNYTVKSPQYQGRPIYTTYLVDSLDPAKPWTSNSNGLVYKFSTQSDNDIYNYLNTDKDLKIMASSMFGLDLLAQYYYSQAAFFVTKRDLGQAQTNFIDAIKYDYKTGGIDQQDFIYYRTKIFESSNP